MAIKATPQRRRLIVIALLATGIVGAVMRQVYPASSVAHDVGTMLLVMWVPAVGNIIGYLVRKWRASRPGPPAFDDAAPFRPQLRVELALDRPAPGPRLVLVVAREAFSARCGEPPVPGGPAQIDLELLAPAAALPRLPAGTSFLVLVGRVVIGKGRVLGAAPDPAGPPGGFVA